ncbi:MAG: glycosyl transferase family 2 [Actinomycetia bacterium]|nr:glycosyl transferase family 2 [Actinomycetes bacterium]
MAQVVSRIVTHPSLAERDDTLEVMLQHERPSRDVVNLTRQATVRRRPASPTVSVVVPTLNEARNLPYALANVPRDVLEIIVVDGRSTDDTALVAQALFPEVRIVHQDRAGKGNALLHGFNAAAGDIIVMFDADGSADGAEIPRFVQALIDGADFAKGSRFAKGGGSADITRLRRLGNAFLNSLVNGLFGTEYEDLCYGYNAFWRRCLPYLAPECDGFEVETLMNIRAHKAGLKVVEVPSFEAARVHGASNLRAVRDGLRVLRTVARERWLTSSAMTRPTVRATSV